MSLFSKHLHRTAHMSIINTYQNKGKDTKMTIQVNGIKFIKLSKNSNEETLEKKGASFFYKKVKAGVRIYDKDKNIFAFLATHEESPFFVSATDTGDEKGKIRYSFALTNDAEKKLGLDTLSFSEERKVAEKAKEAFGF